MNAVFLRSVFRSLRGGLPQTTATVFAHTHSSIGGCRAEPALRDCEIKSGNAVAGLCEAGARAASRRGHRPRLQQDRLLFTQSLSLPNESAIHLLSQNHRPA